MNKFLHSEVNLLIQHIIVQDLDGQNNNMNLLVKWSAGRILKFIINSLFFVIRIFSEFWLILVSLVLGLIELVCDPLNIFHLYIWCSHWFFYFIYSFIHSIKNSRSKLFWQTVNLLGVHDVISHHAVAVTQWPGRLVTSWCSSDLSQHL